MRMEQLKAALQLGIEDLDAGRFVDGEAFFDKLISERSIDTDSAGQLGSRMNAMNDSSTMQGILEKLVHETFGQNLIDNSFRGVWTEFMVAEALGEGCAVVSQNWHPWDLQLGKSEDEFPERIRIQVKNTARLQTWHQSSSTPGACHWVLRMRPKPSYFDQYNPDIPCESYGHLCDVYVLCYHPIDDPRAADHRDPHQWEFYVIPVTPQHGIYPVVGKPEGQKSSPSYTVVPASLRKGIRGRPPIEPLTFNQLTQERIRSALGI